jgi:hypothetical protein
LSGPEILEVRNYLLQYSGGDKIPRDNVSEYESASSEDDCTLKNTEADCYIADNSEPGHNDVEANEANNGESDEDSKSDKNEDGKSNKNNDGKSNEDEDSKPEDDNSEQDSTSERDSNNECNGDSDQDSNGE